MDFISLLATLREGAVLAEAGEELKNLIAAVQATGKGGKISLTLKVDKATKGDDVVFIQDAITVAAPKPDKRQHIFYVRDDHSLSRTDEKQMDFVMDEAETIQEKN